MPRVRVRVRRRRTKQDEHQSVLTTTSETHKQNHQESSKSLNNMHAQNNVVQEQVAEPNIVKNTVENIASQPKQTNSLKRIVEPQKTETKELDLDSLFSAGVAFSASPEATNGPGLSTSEQLVFYGLFKQATAGPCNVKPPSRLSIIKRTKWQAWKDVGGISSEEAKQQYLAELDRLQPTWRSTLPPKSRL